MGRQRVEGEQSREAEEKGPRKEEDMLMFDMEREEKLMRGTWRAKFGQTLEQAKMQVGPS